MLEHSFTRATTRLPHLHSHSSVPSPIITPCYSSVSQVSASYPHEAPKVLCLTKIYHPNIDLEGKVCLNILRDEWKPVLDINAVIYGLIYLFCGASTTVGCTVVMKHMHVSHPPPFHTEPNPNDPLNHEAAALYRDDKAAFDRNVATSLRGGRVGATSFPKLI